MSNQPDSIVVAPQATYSTDATDVSLSPSVLSLPGTGSPPGSHSSGNDDCVDCVAHDPSVLLVDDGLELGLADHSQQRGSPPCDTSAVDHPRQETASAPGGSLAQLAVVSISVGTLTIPHDSDKPHISVTAIDNMEASVSGGRSAIDPTTVGSLAIPDDTDKAELSMSRCDSEQESDVMYNDVGQLEATDSLETGASGSIDNMFLLASDSANDTTNRLPLTDAGKTVNRRHRHVASFRVEMIVVLVMLVFAIGFGFGFLVGRHGQPSTCNPSESNVTVQMPPMCNATSTTGTDDGWVEAGRAAPSSSSLSFMETPPSEASCSDHKRQLKSSVKAIAKGMIQNVSLKMKNVSAIVESVLLYTMLPSSADTPYFSSTGNHLADWVQANDKDLFIAYGDVVVVMNAATTTISTQIAVPIEHSSSRIAGMLLLDNRLVVVVQEFKSIQDPNTSEILQSNTTVLVYSTDDMNLLVKGSLPGIYLEAFADGTNVHVVTDGALDFHWLAEKLLPSSIQMLTNVSLKEDSYRDVAYAQLDILVEQFITQLTTHLPCTGFMILPPFGSNLTATMAASSALSNFASIMSFDVSARIFHKNVTSFLLPFTVSQVHASERHLVLTCAGLSDLPSPFEPETILIAFSLSNASVHFLSVGYVPGSVSVSGETEASPVIIDHFSVAGKDFVRVVTSQYNSTEYFADDDWHVPNVLLVSVLEVSDGGGGNVSMPMVGWLNFGKPGESIASALLDGYKMYIVTWYEDYSTSSFYFYAVDVSDPKDPYVMGELLLPGCPSRLIAAKENLILGVGEHYPDIHVTFQLLSIDVSVSSHPHLVDHWEAEPINARPMTQLTSFLSEHEAFLYDTESNVLIVPMETIRYTCNSDEECFDPGPIEFDGFRLFKINETNGVEELFAIDHSSQMFRCMETYNVMSGRAFVFKGDVTTIKGNTVLSHDLLTKSEDATAVTLSADC